MALTSAVGGEVPIGSSQQTASPTESASRCPMLKTNARMN
jgi:hypothetical protein